MSREIKFRAWFRDWDKKLGEMLYDSEGEYPDVSNTGFIKVVHDGVLYADAPDMGYYGGGDWSYRTGECEIMQYTGLKDKNGKEIYEGDICTAEQMLFPLTGTRTGIVKYHDGAYLLEDLDGKDGDFLFSETAETTVIGNIYESPELTHGT